MGKSWHPEKEARVKAEAGLRAAQTRITVLELSLFAEKRERDLAYERGLTRANEIACNFAATRPQLHPDLPWEKLNDGARMTCHVTALAIGKAIDDERQQPEKVGP